MLLSRRERERDDRGATLVELLVSVIIMGIIALPLGNALLGFIIHTDDTTRRLSDSHDAQLAAAYFAQDVQAIGVHDWSGYPYPLRQSVEPGAVATGGLYPCGDAGTPDAVVRLAWDDPQDATSAPTVIRVSYVVIVTATERQLHRLRCAGSATVESDTVVAHNIDDLIAPVVTCSSECTAAPAVPQSVTLTLTIRDTSSGDPALTVALTGQRRQT